MITTQLPPNEPSSILPITHPALGQQGGLKQMILFIGGALLLKNPYALTPQEIFALIKEHQEWRIDACQGPDRERAAMRNIRWILTKSPAFDHDKSGHWYMTGKPLVRTPNMLPPPPEASTPVMTGAAQPIDPAWTGQSVASSHETENGWRHSEFMTGPVMAETDHLAYPAWTGQPAAPSNGIENHVAYPAWTDQSVGLSNRTGHHVAYSVWTGQSVASSNGASENNQWSHSESTSVPFMSDGYCYGWALEPAGHGPVHYPEES